MPTLYEKLTTAGLPIENATEAGEISGIPDAVMSLEQIQKMSDICLEHFHPQEYALMVRVRDRQTAAHDTAKAIPAWAGWTQAQALDWLNTNIGTPLAQPIPPNPITTAQIRAVLVGIVDTMQKQYQFEQAVAKMLIALRDHTFPDLPE